MKNKPLTAKQRAFCKDYILNGKNATDAYKRHYKAKNDKSAQASSSQLLSKPMVKEYLKELEQVSSEKFNVDKSFIENLLMDIAQSDLSQIAHIKNGQIVLKNDAKNDALKGISSLSASESIGKAGHSKSFSVNNKDRIEAVKMLAKMNGVDLGGENGNNDGNGKSGLSKLLKIAREVGKGK